MIPKELQYTEKKLLMLTKRQKSSLEKLSQYGVNVSEFIRRAIRRQIKDEWPEIKDNKDKVKLPF
jgi:hypothetical protein